MANEIIKSPGINNNYLINKIKSKGIPIISELMFAQRYNKSPIIAITGSNGKTTTSLLIYHLLKDYISVGLSGNIGNSFALEIAKNKIFDYYILEISSFQLYDSVRFKPYIAILLNISYDHMDWYNYNLKLYIDSKLSITKYQNNKDFFIFNKDNFYIKNEIENNINIKAISIPITNNNYLQFLQEINFKIEEINYLLKYHNIYNIMSAIWVAKIFNIDNTIIKNKLITFKPVNHRLENFLNINGIQFINDSKATNVDATLHAINKIDFPIIWIAGGYDKGNDYNQLLNLVKKKVKYLICLGKHKKIIDTFKTIIPIFIAENMKEAVYKVYLLSNKGDKILLSPSCSSYDMFRDYKDRGRQFKNEVKKIFL